MKTADGRKTIIDILGRDAAKKMAEFIQHSVYNFIGDELEIKIAFPEYMVNDIMDSFAEKDLRITKIVRDFIIGYCREQIILRCWHQKLLSRS